MKTYKKLIKRKIQSMLKISVTIAAITGLIGFISGMMQGAAFAVSLNSGLISALLGFLNPACIFIFEDFLLSRRSVRSLSLPLLLTLRILLYLIIGIVMYTIVGIAFFPDELYEKGNLIFTFSALFGISFIINISVFFTQFLGKGFFKSYLFATHHRASVSNYCFMFIDLCDSTVLGEKLSPSLFFNCLNDFIFICEEVISFYNGKIYKYVGDCIIVVWDEMEKPLLQAYECSVEILSHLNDNKDYFRKMYDFDIRFSMGVHTGPAAVGEIGFDRKEIGYLSDTVNTAQRIQGLNKQLGTTVLYSESFIEKLRGFNPELIKKEQFTLHEGPQMKGKSQRIDVYSPAKGTSAGV
ncbi:MAG TPA: adenylate/guanylate cyclase domain-containing protein [Treponemataceae bacterium]|nr:adenylate/guanylate cyclase domain-containing protein [Treponemataceae bacterium]